MGGDRLLAGSGVTCFSDTISAALHLLKPPCCKKKERKKEQNEQFTHKLLMCPVFFAEDHVARLVPSVRHSQEATYWPSYQPLDHPNAAMSMDTILFTCIVMRTMSTCTYLSDI